MTTTLSLMQTTHPMHPQPGWLTVSGTPLAILSPPVLEPAPSYQRDRDMVIGWHDVTYGKPAWSLPRCSRCEPSVRTPAL